MIALGLRLDWVGTEALSWRDLLVIIRQAPRGSAIRRAVDPADSHTAELEMLRQIEHGVRIVAWMQSRDASRGRNRPERITLPWEPKERWIDADVMPVDEMARRLGWPTK